MRTFTLPLGATASEWGEAHGEAFAEEIGEIAQIRTELCLTVGGFKSTADVYDLARLHLPVLEAFDQALYDELIGIAAGSGRTPEEIIIVNHYTDMRDMGPLIAGAEECTVVLAESDEGSFLAQTWDMHASAKAYVLMFQVPEIDGSPAAWMLSITGCVGMAGMNEFGVGCTINNLRSTDAHVGVVWPALVRKVLREKNASDGRDVIMDANIGSGHHYLVADKKQAYGIETSGRLKKYVHEGTPGNFMHTNHCLDEEVGACTAVTAESTTYHRYDWMTKSLDFLPVVGEEDLWMRLNQPGGVWLDQSSPDKPHAPATCGVISMNLDTHVIKAAPGFARAADPLTFRFGKHGR